jgi:hypothetical protein
MGFEKKSDGVTGISGLVRLVSAVPWMIWHIPGRGERSVAKRNKR